MGQQQLLLIILGVIIVGIAVAVGITMFQDNAISANKDAVTNDLVNLAAKAQQFFRKPVALGGGGNAFSGNGNNVDSIGVLVSPAFYDNDNGGYSISTLAATSIMFVGVGKTQDQDGLYPLNTMTVTATGYVLGTWATTDAPLY
jgi:hypothetical protein